MHWKTAQRIIGLDENFMIPPSMGCEEVRQRVPYDEDSEASAELEVVEDAEHRKLKE